MTKITDINNQIICYAVAMELTHFLCKKIFSQSGSTQKY